MTILRRGLTVTDRTTIKRRLLVGCRIRAIARVPGRLAGTISGAVSRHKGGLSQYDATAAGDRAAAARLRSGCQGAAGQRGRPVRRGHLADAAEVFARADRWPAQTNRRRHGAAIDLSVSHEAICRAIYAVPRGELRRELIACLRQDKPHCRRKPKGSERRGKLRDMTNICERPEEIAGRLVPGHREGDLILGANHASAIGTLVERTTRFVLLVRMPTRKTDVATSAFAGALNAIPAPLRQTLIYDQGKEMAAHEKLALDTGMHIFFADPHSAWQRGLNENTNGLPRRYFPKGTSLSGLSKDDLDVVARSLNDRPRKTLDYATPNEQFQQTAG